MTRPPWCHSGGRKHLYFLVACGHQSRQRGVSPAVSWSVSFHIGRAAAFCPLSQAWLEGCGGDASSRHITGRVTSGLWFISLTQKLVRGVFLRSGPLGLVCCCQKCRKIGCLWRRKTCLKGWNDPHWQHFSLTWVLYSATRAKQCQEPTLPWQCFQVKTENFGSVLADHLNEKAWKWNERKTIR